VVRDQLVSLGIEREKIWGVPYGADSTVFFQGDESSREEFRVVFAGQFGLRKGSKTLLDALELASKKKWRIDFYGAVLPEAKRDIADYRGDIALHFHGAVAQSALASAFRKSSVLVLPSLEEGFGLVIPQALNTGLPCVVSDRVGAKDLIRHRANGSVFPVQNAEALFAELCWWEANPARTQEAHGWRAPAETLISLSEAASLKR